MRLYSSAVMLCWASNCGVTATGEGTTAEEAGFITVASIVARHQAPAVRQTPSAGRAYKKGAGKGLGMGWKGNSGASHRICAAERRRLPSNREEHSTK